MEAMLGASVTTFIFVTVILFGAIAFRTGQAVAGTWKPIWQLWPYTLLLAGANRFLVSALFGWPMFSPPAFLVAWLVLAGFAFAAYRMTLVHKMVTQYPWLYRRTGAFSFVEIGRDADRALV